MGVHLRCTTAPELCIRMPTLRHRPSVRRLRICAHWCARHIGQVIDNLNLDERATKEACALARNAYTRTRLLKDFYDGIHEIHRNSGTAKMQHAKMQQ